MSCRCRRKTVPGPDAVPFCRLDDGREDGAVSSDGRIFGSYLHGLFDNDALRGSILEKLSGTKSERAQTSYSQFKDGQYELLADTFEEFVDTDALFRIAGLTREEADV